MKVLFVSAYQSRGGASWAARNLARALNALDFFDIQVEEIFYYNDGNMIDRVFRLFRIIWDRFPVFVFSGKKILFSPQRCRNSTLIKYINSQEVDIVHFHWVHAGMFSLSDISKIRHPVVWSMHDNWIYTAGCHVTYHCNNFVEECCCCQLFPFNQNFAHNLFKYKRALLSSLANLDVVGVSRWIVDQASKSTILCNARIHLIPNIIDTDLFVVRNRIEACRILNLNVSDKYVVYCSHSDLYNINKGFLSLIEALNLLEEKITLIVFGYSNNISCEYRGDVINLGVIHDKIKLSYLYSAAIMTIVPSVQESFGQVAAESMSCGTPVVSFATSGLVDIVDHKINGYLAEIDDISDLAFGINWILTFFDYNSLSNAAREKVVKCFSTKIITNRFIELYKTILSKNN